jgi:hypothetical protein
MDILHAESSSECVVDIEKIMTLHAPAQALGALGVCAAIAVCTLYVAKSTAQSTKEGQQQAGREASPIYGVTIPAGYRDWQVDFRRPPLSLAAMTACASTKSNAPACKVEPNGNVPQARACGSELPLSLNAVLADAFLARSATPLLIKLERNRNILSELFC